MENGTNNNRRRRGNKRGHGLQLNAGRERLAARLQTLERHADRAAKVMNGAPGYRELLDDAGHKETLAEYESTLEWLKGIDTSAATRVDMAVAHGAIDACYKRVLQPALGLTPR